MNDEKLIPKLRFNGFDNEWESFKLTEISERITRKNKSLETDRPLTISAQYGLVDQIEFFNKIVASKSLKGYYLLKNGEFAYNKSYSNGYPFGAVKRLDKYENGAISTLYICFKVNDKMNSDLMKEYFETDKWYKEIYKIAVKGARNHGLLNIAVGDFFNTKHILPTNRDEQEKIANFLIEINKKIDLLENKLLNYQNFKKYLMHQIFAQKLRFNFSDEWKIVKLESLIKKGKAGGTPSSTNSDYYNGDIPFLSIRDMTEQGKYILKTEKTITEEGLNNSSAWIIPKNSLLYSIYASIGLVAINRSDISTSQAIYGIILKEGVSLEYMYYYLTYFKKNIHKYIETGTQGNLNAKLLKSFEILLPSLEEQEMIVNVLSIVDEKIENSKKEIEKINEFKKGLLQQMFNNVRLVVINLIINEYICPL